MVPHVRDLIPLYTLTTYSSSIGVTTIPCHHYHDNNTNKLSLTRKLPNAELNTAAACMVTMEKSQ